MKQNNYWSPILAGILLGVALFISFMIAGQGMGASGAFARTTAQAIYTVDPSFAQNAYAGKYLKHGDALINWTVIEVVGIFIGGLVSALFARRIKPETTRAKGYSIGKRLEGVQVDKH